MTTTIICEACDKPATYSITAIVGEWIGKAKNWCTVHYNETVKELEK